MELESLSMCCHFSWTNQDLLYSLSWWIITLQPAGLVLSIHPGCMKLCAVIQVWGQSNVASLLMQNKGEAMLSCMPEGETWEKWWIILKGHSVGIITECLLGMAGEVESLGVPSRASWPAAWNGAPCRQWTARPKNASLHWLPISLPWVALPANQVLSTREESVCRQSWLGVGICVLRKSSE